MKAKLWTILCLSLSFACADLGAQEIKRGKREFEFFAQGGPSVSGGRTDIGVFNAGLRFGYALLNIGPGSLEHELEFIPVFYVAQPGKNAYGISFTPFDLKYNFRRDTTRTIPFIELGGGVLFTNNDVPSGTNSVNFTPQAGIGVHIPFGARAYHATVALKYVHISNAGLSVPNPGVNTIQFRIGVGKFK